jgi:hypothetical protein
MNTNEINNIENDSLFQFNIEDRKELESFCKKHGIVGFECGNMNPKAALKMLKSRLGILEETPINKTKLLLG